MPDIIALQYKLKDKITTVRLFKYHSSITVEEKDKETKVKQTYISLQTTRKLLYKEYIKEGFVELP